MKPKLNNFKIGDIVRLIGYVGISFDKPKVTFTKNIPDFFVKHIAKKTKFIIKEKDNNKIPGYTLVDKATQEISQRTIFGYEIQKINNKVIDWEKEIADQRLFK